MPLTWCLWRLVRQTDLPEALAPAAGFCLTLVVLNLVILVFNLLPIYPLDGGQMLHALLWYVLGRARSLAVCCILALPGAAGLVLLALWLHSIWISIVAVLVAVYAVAGLVQARKLTWALPVQDHLCRGAEGRGRRQLAGSSRNL